jgi:GNAT superfamily N-acetyltransferase
MMAPSAKMRLKIRAATVADVFDMHCIRKRVRENRLSGTTRIQETTYLPYIAASSAWVAETDYGISGFAVIDAPSKSVWALFVDPGAERLGIGRALHFKMVNWAKQQGIDRLSLSTQEGSRAAKFYRQAGWSEIRTKHGGEVIFERSTTLSTG